MLGVAPGPVGAGGGGRGAGGGVGGSACTWTRGGSGLGGVTLPDGPDAQAESVSVVARSRASRRRLVIALAWRAPPALRGNRWLLRGRRPWRRRRRDLHWPGRRRLHERRRLPRHRRDLARAGERLTWYGLPWDRLSRHRHRGTGRPGRYRT